LGLNPTGIRAIGVDCGSGWPANPIGDAVIESASAFRPGSLRNISPEPTSPRTPPALELHLSA